MAGIRHVFALVAVASAIACHDRRPPPPVPRQETSAVRDSVAADTVVRRVFRVTRRATTMQRVTGALTATRALAPLDSMLVIRVSDQRGLEMQDVPVQWTTRNTGEGAALRVVDAATDTAGLARATFTPGRSADPQSVFAEVANVGRIEFAVTVPATSIRVIPGRATIWASDDTILEAELRDTSEHVLAGGLVSWATTDTSTVRVRSEDRSRGRVTGALAGSTNIVAWVGAGTVRASAHVIVRPVVVGRFVTLDGSAPPAMRLDFRSVGVRDSILVEHGSFTRRIELPLEAEVYVRATPLADSAKFHPVQLLIEPQRELQNLTIALVPTTVRIERGSYTGRDVAIDAARALQRSGKSAPFWRLVPLSGNGPRKLLGWREADVPLRIAFDRSRSAEQITPEDSLAFWAIARDMERDLGAPLFAPAEMRDSIRSNVVPVEIGAQASEGHTFVSWGQPGDATNAVVLFRHEATLRDSHVVTHELVHLLGFGHSTAWPTISQAVGGTQPRLTPEDVAYIQLAMRLRRLQEQTGARPGLPVAVQ